MFRYKYFLITRLLILGLLSLLGFSVIFTKISSISSTSISSSFSLTTLPLKHNGNNALINPSIINPTSNVKMSLDSIIAPRNESKVESFNVLQILTGYNKHLNNLNQLSLSNSELPQTISNISSIPITPIPQSIKPSIDNNHSVPTEIVKQVYLPNLMYHYIRDFTANNNSLGASLSVSPQNFDIQMKELKNSGYNSITYTDLINFIYKNKALPIHPILVTFDDGYEDAYINALPILNKYNIKGNFAVITNFTNNPAYLSWTQIKQMKNQGHEIVSHTENHIQLNSVSTQQIINELKNSKNTLDRILNQNTQTIVYPYGKFNQNVEDIAKKEGYKIGRTTLGGSLISSDNLYELPQQRMTNASHIK